MTSTRNLVAIANTQTFQDRIKFFLFKAAINVLAEDPGTLGHPQRIIFANDILSGSNSILDFAIGVLTNPTISQGANPDDSNDGIYGVSDGDMEFTVNSLYNAFAGAAK